MLYFGEKNFLDSHIFS